MDTEIIYKALKEKPSKESFDKCMEYCYSHEYNASNSLNDELFFYAATYLMRMKIGELTDEDAKVLIRFFSKTYAKTVGIDQNLEIQILSNEEYIAKCGENSKATCSKSEDRHAIYYSPGIINQLESDNISVFLRGMQSIIHEVVHALQNNSIYSNGIHEGKIEPKLSMYTEVIETITRRVDPKFYNENYKNLYKENHAEYIGLQTAIAFIKKFNPKLYDLYNIDKINKQIEEYKSSMKASIKVFFTEGSHLKAMDPAVCIYIDKNPKVLEEFPILSLAFNKDGKKKSLSELLQERRAKFDKYPKREELDELYEALCIDQNVVAGGQKGTKEQLKELIDYMINGFDDFEYGILEKKLSHKSIPQEIKDNILQGIEKYRLPNEAPNPMGM